jgi:hypothetical protein
VLQWGYGDPVLLEVFSELETPNIPKYIFKVHIVHPIIDIYRIGSPNSETKSLHPSDLGAGVGSISGCSKLLRLPQLQGDVGELGMDPFWLRYVDQNASPSPQNPVVKIITFRIKTYPNCHLLVVICQF